MRHLKELILSVLVLTGCQSLQPYAVDYLVPADVSFPASLRTVGIVNAVQERPSRLEGRFQDLPDQDDNYLYRNTSYLQSSGENMASELASALAQENYFDEVIILDSVVIIPDAARGRLSSEQVSELCAYLGVDFIISIEDLQMRRQDEVAYDDYFGFYIGTTDAKIEPRVGIYYPQASERSALLIQPTDSIFWQTPGTSMSFTKRHLLSDVQMEEEASEYSSQLILDRILPYWKTEVRYYADGGNPLMRDAGVSVKEGDWDTAIELWKQAYEKKSLKKKTSAALNLALGYEMKDDLQEAVSWARKAKDHAYEWEKVASQDLTLSSSDCKYYTLASVYQEQLEKRYKDVAKLKAQMAPLGY